MAEQRGSNSSNHAGKRVQLSVDLSEEQQQAVEAEARAAQGDGDGGLALFEPDGRSEASSSGSSPAGQEGPSPMEAAAEADAGAGAGLGDAAAGGAMAAGAGAGQAPRVVLGSNEADAGAAADGGAAEPEARAEEGEGPPSAAGAEDTPEARQRAERRAQQREELDAEYPLPSDSAVCDVKYLGRVKVEGDPQNPPDGDTCADAVRFLKRQISRSKYREGVAKRMKLKVCARRRLLLAAAARSQGDGAAAGMGFKQSLMQVTCVADHFSYVCYVAGRLDRERNLVCHAYAFECENEYAARYIAEEVVKACRILFDRARHVSRMQQAAVAPPKEKKRREPNESDMLFLDSVRALEAAVLSAQAEQRTPRAKKLKGSPEATVVVVPDADDAQDSEAEAEAPRKDNLYRVCCNSFGRCKCKKPSVVSDADIAVDPLHIRAELDANNRRHTWRKSTMSEPVELVVGTRVFLRGLCTGYVRYCGPNRSGNRGLRCGVELDKPMGNCDGLLPKEGRYFQCRDMHGLVFTPGDYAVAVLTADDTIMEERA